jgi:hypothetical protein
MRQKFSREEVVCISVSLDSVADKDKALGFLTKQKAEFPNYLLDEDSDVWQAKWDVSGPPIVFVFDRQGRRAAKFVTNADRPYTYKDIEERVKELLKQQP